MRKEKKKRWNEDEWHAVNSTVGFLEWKTIDRISKETGIERETVKLILEDFMKEPDMVVKKGKSYKYFHALDCYEDV